VLTVNIIIRYDAIRDAILTCARKPTPSQLSLPHFYDAAATSSDLGLLANMASSINRKYITYHYAARGGPSHGHRQLAWKLVNVGHVYIVPHFMTHFYVLCLRPYLCIGWSSVAESGARFTKYLTTILRFSYDNAKVTIDLRRTTNLQNSLQWTEGFS